MKTVATAKPAGYVSRAKDYALKHNTYYWLNLLTKFASVLILVKIFGLISNFFLIHYMSKDEYAWFTIANTIIISIATLSESGISSGISAIGGKIWNDNKKVSQLLTTALSLRGTITIFVSGVALPLLLWILISHDAKFVYAVGMSLVVVLGAYFQITNAMYLMVLKLRNEFQKVQKLEILGASIRLVLITLLASLFINSFVVIAIITFAYFVCGKFLQKWLKMLTENRFIINKQYKQKIFKIVKHQLPNDIYYCITGQIAVILMWFFGSVNEVADIGALSKLIMAFSIISVTFNNIILPSFSKCHNAQKLSVMFGMTIFCYSVITLLLLGFAYNFPNQFLWILGHKYSHLSEELLWSILNMGLNMLVGVVFSINLSKGWILSSWVLIPLGTLVQILGLLLLDLTIVKGVYIYNILIQLPFLLLFITLFIKKLKGCRYKIASMK